MEALHNWQNQIQNHITDSGLMNLSEYKVNGVNVFATFSNFTRGKTILKKFSYSDFKHADEFNFISMDMIYATAILEILHPHINNAIKEKGTYHMTLEDHLYLRYAGFGFQSIYQFWDRIGDLLDMFFDTKQNDDVYISRVLARFPEQYRSKTFDSLKKLYDEKVLPVLESRHSIVHQFNLKAKFYWGVMEHGFKDPEALERLQNEKDSFPSLFREQIQYMFEAFDLSLKLIGELPDIKIGEISA